MTIYQIPQIVPPQYLPTPNELLLVASGDLRVSYKNLIQSVLL